MFLFVFHFSVYPSFYPPLAFLFPIYASLPLFTSPFRFPDSLHVCPFQTNACSFTRFPCLSFEPPVAFLLLLLSFTVPYSCTFPGLPASMIEFHHVCSFQSNACSFLFPFSVSLHPPLAFFLSLSSQSLPIFNRPFYSVHFLHVCSF